MNSSVHGLQLTTQVPIYCSKEKRWKNKFPMDPVSFPACQIYHSHNYHWVCSVSHQNDVYLLDSLCCDRPIDRILPNSLKIQ